VKLTSVVFQHFGFLPKDQHYSPARAAKIQGLIALIEHQNRTIYHITTRLLISAILASLSGQRNNLHPFILLHG